MAKVGVDLYIDAGPALAMLDEAQKLLSPEKAKTLLHDTLVDTSRKAKTIVSDCVVQDYTVPKGWAADQVGFPQVSYGTGLSVWIPIRGARGGIGQIYPIADAGGGKRKRRIRANIVQGKTSVLPKTMDHQGGNPPFVGKGMVFTRKTKARYPIVRVVGLGVPQMPLNRSQKKIEDALEAEIAKSASRHFGRLFGGNA